MGLKNLYKSFFYWFKKVSDILEKVSIVAGGILLIFVTFIVILSVFYRYILMNSLRWAEESARYILIWLTLIVSSVAFKRRENISLTAVTEMLSSQFRLILEMIVHSIIVIIISIVLKYSYIMVMTRSLNNYSPAMQINMGWAHSSLLVGFCLIIFQSLYVILDDIKTLIVDSK